MSVTRIVIMVIVFAIALTALVISVLQFACKGVPLNNTYIYATDTYRVSIYKKPLFIQSGITFLLLAFTFACIGVYVITGVGVLLTAEFILLAITIVYAIISSIIISKKYGMM